VKAQIEGSTLWGMSLALFEQAPLERCAAGQQLQRLHAASDERDARPRHLDHRQQQRPASGWREPIVRAVAPAIANAIFKAVGVRLRSLPITQADMRRELQAKKT
jgi:isoquinoline 1-oxidoreductase